MTDVVVQYADPAELAKIKSLTRQLSEDDRAAMVDGGLVCGIELVRDRDGVREVVATAAQARGVLASLHARVNGRTLDIPEDPEDLAPYTPYEIEVLLRRISRRLLQISNVQGGEHGNNARWAEAKRELTVKRGPAVIKSYDEDPSAPKWVHEARADAETVDESATAFAWERIVRGLNDEAHNLRQIQSSLQTLYKSIADQAGLR